MIGCFPLGHTEARVAELAVQSGRQGQVIAYFHDYPTIRSWHRRMSLSCPVPPQAKAPRSECTPAVTRPPPLSPSFLGPVFRPLSRWERVRVRVDDYSVNNLV